MKRRFLAMFTAVLMLVSAFCGCTNEGDSNIESSEIEKSAKEIFTSFFQLKENTSFDPEKLYANIKGSLESDIMGESQEIDFDFDVKTSAPAVQGNFNIEIADEKLGGSYVNDGSYSYLSLPDINELPIRTKEEEEIVEDEEASDEEIAPFEEIAEFLGKIKEYLDSGKLDSLFTKSREDIKIGEVQFTAAQIVTAEVTDEKLKELMGEDYSDELEEYDYTFRCHIVVEDDQCKGTLCNADLTYTEDVKTTAVTIDFGSTENNVFLNVKGESGDDDFIISFNHNNTEEGENGKIEIKTETNENAEETFFTAESSYDYTTETTIIVDYENGEGAVDFITVTRDGDETTEDETASYAVYFGYGKEDETSYFEITKIEAKVAGVTMGFDVVCKLTWKPLEKGVEIGFDVDVDLMGMAIEAKGSFNINQIDEFEVALSEEFDDYEDIEEDFISAFNEKSPLIAEFMGFSAYDDDFIEDSDYFEVYNDAYTYCYTFYDDGTGELYIDQYTLKSNDGENAVLSWDGGDDIIINYDKSQFENGIVTIGGFDFEILDVPADDISEHFVNIDYYATVYDEEWDMVFEECLVNFTYFPENKSGMFCAAFEYTNDGDNYTLTFLGDTVVEKTIVYDEATGLYFFQ